MTIPRLRLHFNLHKFLKARGYSIPVLITCMFLLFVPVPSIVRTGCAASDCSVLPLLKHVWFITYPLNNVSDVLIYVIFDPDIRTYLRKKLKPRDITDERNNNNTSSQFESRSTTVTSLEADTAV